MKYIYQVELGPYSQTPYVTRYRLVKSTPKSVVIARPDTDTPQCGRRLYRAPGVYLFDTEEEAVAAAVAMAQRRLHNREREIADLIKFINQATTTPNTIKRDGRY